MLIHSCVEIMCALWVCMDMYKFKIELHFYYGRSLLYALFFRML